LSALPGKDGISGFGVHAIGAAAESCCSAPQGKAMPNDKPDLESYKRQLEELCSLLTPCAERTAVRGTDLAQFAWAESHGRSVCISWCEGGVFVELWEGDTETEEAEYPSYEVGVRVATRWLSGTNAIRSTVPVPPQR
jgi:hypothetical protein